MRILVVTHYFPPEIGAPQARLSELARTWAAEGDDVTVLTGLPNHPTGIIPPDYRGVRRVIEHVEGYRVVRTWLYATPNEGIVKKTLGHLSFMVTSVVLGGRAAGPADVVVVSSPTFFAILSAWFMARRKRARFVVEIRDLWPAIFVELGVLTNPVIIKVLETIELAAYRAADEVVVVSEGFRENLIERGVPADKIHTIRNGVDLERFTPAPGDPDTVAANRSRLGAAPDDTLVLYIGAHGISHGLTSIADAAELLRGEPVHVAFVGEGSAKGALEDRVRELALDNVTLLPGVPRDDVALLLQAADICLVPLRDVPLFTTFIPSKIFEYFGSGKAVIGAVRGEPAEILREGGALVVEPQDSPAIAGAIRTLAADPARRLEMGRTGHAYVTRQFDRRDLAHTYRVVLQGTSRRHDGDGPAGEASTASTAARGRNPGRDRRRAGVGLIPFVWRHPENASSGWRGRTRAMARLTAWQIWQRGAKRPWTITLIDGMRLRCHPHSSQASAAIYCGLREYEEMHFVQDYLRAGDQFVDVGANIGVYSLIAASVHGTEIVAFEPSSATFPKLIENVTLNHLEHRFHGHRVAVGSIAGPVFLTTGHDTTNHLLPAATANGTSALLFERVDLVTLDDTITDRDTVAVLKIDVEGAEADVLAGATKLLTRVQPIVIVEANDPGAIASALEPFGYLPCAYDPTTRQLHKVTWHDHQGRNVLAVADLDAARARLEGR